MIYVLSDVHGRKNRLVRMLKKINFGPEDTLYILGDVVDRGPDGVSILQMVSQMPNVKLLLGNHEYEMLCTLEDIPSNTYNHRRTWYKNRGDVTEKAFLKLPEAEQKALLAYLHTLPLRFDVTVNGQRYILIHASLTELYSPELAGVHEDAEGFAVWDRKAILDYDSGGAILLIGHTPVNYLPFRPKGKQLKIVRYGNKWFIDCGCAIFGFAEGLCGRLGCVCLDTGEEFYVPARGSELNR